MEQGVFGKVLEEARRRRAEHVSRGSLSLPSNEMLIERRSADAIRRATAWGLPPETWGITFDSFDLTGIEPSLRKAYEGVLALVKGETYAVLLTGSPGTGKSHLAYAAANHCRIRAWPFLFRRVPDVMSELRNAIKHGGGDQPSADDLIRMFSGEMLLVLDDLGAHQETEYASAVLYDIVDARYRKKLPTIITTNHAPDAIDGRIASRFYLGTYECNGADKRRRYG